MWLKLLKYWNLSISFTGQEEERQSRNLALSQCLLTLPILVGSHTDGSGHWTHDRQSAPNPVWSNTWLDTHWASCAYMGITHMDRAHLFQLPAKVPGPFVQFLRLPKSFHWDGIFKPLHLIKIVEALYVCSVHLQGYCLRVSQMVKEDVVTLCEGPLLQILILNIFKQRRNNV